MVSYLNIVKMNAKGIRFQSFSSGSSGNCYYLGNGKGGILIDAGVGIRRLKAQLARIGLGFDKIHAVLITHDHFDHIRSLGSYCKRLVKPVWMTRELYASLSKNWMISPHLKPVVKILPESGPAELVEGSIFATPFVVPHDATQTLGYAIEIDGYKFVIMTDIGSMTDEAINYAKGLYRCCRSQLRPQYATPRPIRALQDRICGGCGHLSNDECADAIRDFMHEGLRNIFLCHLSAKTTLRASAANRIEGRRGHRGTLGGSSRTQTSAFMNYIISLPDYIISYYEGLHKHDEALCQTLQQNVWAGSYECSLCGFQYIFLHPHNSHPQHSVPAE